MDAPTGRSSFCKCSVVTKCAEHKSHLRYFKVRMMPLAARVRINSGPGPSQFRIVLKGPLLLHFARSRGWPGPALDGASWQGLVGDSFALRMNANLTCKTREGDIQILTVGNVRAAVESEWQLLCGAIHPATVDPGTWNSVWHRCHW